MMKVLRKTKIVILIEVDSGADVFSFLLPFFSNAFDA